MIYSPIVKAIGGVDSGHPTQGQRNDLHVARLDGDPEAGLTSLSPLRNVTGIAAHVAGVSYGQMAVDLVSGYLDYIKRKALSLWATVLIYYPVAMPYLVAIGGIVTAWVVARCVASARRPPLIPYQTADPVGLYHRLQAAGVDCKLTDDGILLVKANQLGYVRQLERGLSR